MRVHEFTVDPVPDTTTTTAVVPETVNDQVFSTDYDQSRHVLSGSVRLQARAGFTGYGQPAPGTRSTEFTITAHDSDTHDLIAQVTFRRHGDYLRAHDLFVVPQHQGRGIAREMYKFARETGNDIQPSDLQTPAGRRFWRRGGGAGT